MEVRNHRLVPVAILTIVVLAAQSAPACEFCNAPFLTISEQLDQANAVVLVTWKGGKKGDERSLGSTRYEISKVVKGSSPALKQGGNIRLPRYRSGKKGDLFLLLGSRGVNVNWGSPLEVSAGSFKYAENAPGPKEAGAKRLRYFVDYLEFPDPIIANDAYAEFAHASYKDITKIADAMPRDRLRKWLTSSDTPPTRLGLYGLLLGLCGKKEDAKLMHGKIVAKSDEFRLGIDGIMAGYLMLAGEEGLTVIENAKLKNKKAPFTETYAAIQAMRFIWNYGGGKVSKARLRQAMRTLLDRPELADLVITDLARWKDWSVQDRLMKLYGTEEYNAPSVKRAIVRFMLASVQDVKDATAGADLPPHVVNGKKYVAAIEKQDPKTVRDVKRFLFIK